VAPRSGPPHRASEGRRSQPPSGPLPARRPSGASQPFERPGADADHSWPEPVRGCGRKFSGRSRGLARWAITRFRRLLARRVRGQPAAPAIGESVPQAAAALPLCSSRQFQNSSRLSRAEKQGLHQHVAVLIGPLLDITEACAASPSGESRGRWRIARKLPAFKADSGRLHPVGGWRASAQEHSPVQGPLRWLAEAAGCRESRSSSTGPPPPGRVAELQRCTLPAHNVHSCDCFADQLASSQAPLAAIRPKQTAEQEGQTLRPAAARCGPCPVR